MPSPQTPLPERARGFENLQLFLAPLLLLWEKGLGDEGKRFVSQSAQTSGETAFEVVIFTAMHQSPLAIFVHLQYYSLALPALC
jgi:hypothetical protein